MKKLVIQAGFPKCGSTSIAAALKLTADHLKAHGIFVLNNQFTRDRSGNIPGLTPQARAKLMFDAETAAPLRAALEKTIQGSPRNATLVICTELFAEPAFAPFFAGLEDLCEMELVFYFRPQSAWLASAWKQWDLKSGTTLPKMVKLALTEKRPDYLNTATGWHAAIPRMRITPRPFLRETMHNGQPSYDFLKLLGAEIAPDPALEKRSNPSMDFALLHLFQRNSAQIFKSRHDNAPYRRVLEALPPAYRSVNIPMLTQRQADRIANHFHADTVELMVRFMGLPKDEAEAFVTRHFHETVTGKAFSDHTEAEIMERAAMILHQMTGKTGDPDTLLLDFLAEAPTEPARG